MTSEICSYVNAQGDTFLWVSDAYLDSGQCSASSSTNLPPVTWDAGATVCGTSQSDFDVCDDGVCVPYDSRLCVFRPNELAECPMGYPYPLNAYSEFVDNRSCSNCSCEVEEDCTGTVSLYQSGTGLCNSPGPESMPGDGTCHDVIAGGYQSAYWNIDEMSCGVAQPSNPVGEATPSLGSRVCCTSE
jgi:hypothetical protein